jgi:hypothetical protein
MMRLTKTAVAAAVVIGCSLPIAGSANPTISAVGVQAAFDHIAVVEHVQYYRYGGHRHCWYGDGWNGPGWYWCGYGARHGHGYGGGEGYRGWRH